MSSTSGQPRGFILYSDDSGDTCSLVEVDELINVTDLLLDYNEETDEHRVFAPSTAADGNGYVYLIEDGAVAATWDFEGEDVSDLDIDLQLGTLYAVANDTASNGAPTLYYKPESVS